MSDNPLLGLREIDREKVESAEPEKKAVSTGTRKPVRAEAREDGQTAVRQDASTDTRTDGREDARADLRTRIRERLAAKAEMPTGVKATIDMTPELSKRVKRYGLDHKGGTLRQMCIVFLEEFLDEEGY